MQGEGWSIQLIGTHRSTPSSTTWDIYTYIYIYIFDIGAAGASAVAAALSPPPPFLTGVVARGQTSLKGRAGGGSREAGRRRVE